MKKVGSFALLIAVLKGAPVQATLLYGLSVSTPGFTALSGATSIPNFTNACSDGLFSGPLSIGFTFVYDSQNYTRFQVTENGRLFLLTAAGTAVATCSDNCGAGCDGFGPNYQVQSSSGAGNGLSGSVIHPTICPLWDDLGMNVAGSKVTYKLSGSSPNRTLTVEWLLMDWKFSNATMANTSTISFQAIIYESPAGQIDFIYRREPEGLGAVPNQHARIGLTGVAVGDFYSTDANGSAPSKLSESDVAAKPIDGVRFRWTPGVPTPVELVTFEGWNAGNKNVLTWKTASEKANDFFTIDRSTDALNFEPIGSVRGAGNSHELLSYEFTDASLPELFNLFYYRLTQMDLNGTASESEIISVSVADKDEPPDIFYDNSSGELRLVYTFRQTGLFSVEVSDLLGKTICRKDLFVNSKGRAVFSTLLPSLPAGIYNTRIAGANEAVQSKFINY
jgi:hypothetical protein